MTDVQLVGEGGSVAVSSHNAAGVFQEVADLKPLGTPNRLRYFSALLGTTGADSGTTNMNVNAGPTEFYIAHHADYDIRIMGLAILIADQTVALNKFGAVTALTTGWDLKVREAGAITFIIKKAKTGGEVVVQSGLARPYGTSASPFELANWTATTSGQTIYFPLSEYVPGGFRIGRGTQDRIIAVVNDDLTGLTEMRVRVFGHRHYP